MNKNKKALKIKMFPELKNALLSVFAIFIFSTLAQSQPYTQSGGTVTKTNQNYTSSSTDSSGILVTNLGVFTLTSSIINTTGNSSSTDKSSQYGLNAAVLTTTSGKVVLTDCSITTSGSGANGLFATGSGSSITMTNGTIAATGGNAHGVDVTYTGTIILSNVSISTTGGSSSVLATDFGGGTVTVTGGTFTAAGSKSAGIYSTGVITVTGAVVKANGDNGAVIDADGTIILNNTNLTGAQNGLMIHNTVGQMSLKATYTMNGGSITGNGGDAFNITGSKATITVKGSTTVSASTGIIVDAVSSSIVTFVADGEKITGNIITDNTSTIAATLQNSTALTGIINSAALSMDATSSWSLKGNSYVTSFSDAGGITGSSVTNIAGNGFSVYYDATLSANSALGGKTYSLTGGGYLLPKGASSVNKLSIDLPSNWSLDQNYPNPFNPTTSFSFSLPEESLVTLKVYDVIGKEVSTLVNGHLAAGKYSCNWNAAGVPSGTYFYSINATALKGEKNETFKQVKKLLLLK